MAKKIENPTIAGEIFSAYKNQPDKRHIPHYAKWAGFARESADRLNLEAANTDRPLPYGKPWEELPEGEQAEGVEGNNFWIGKRTTFKKQNGEFTIEERLVQKTTDKSAFAYAD